MFKYIVRFKVSGQETYEEKEIHALSSRQALDIARVELKKEFCREAERFVDEDIVFECSSEGGYVFNQKMRPL